MNKKLFDNGSISNAVTVVSLGIATTLVYDTITSASKYKIYFDAQSKSFIVEETTSNHPILSLLIICISVVIISLFLQYIRPFIKNCIQSRVVKRNRIYTARYVVNEYLTIKANIKEISLFFDSSILASEMRLSVFNDLILQGHKLYQLCCTSKESNQVALKAAFGVGKVSGVSNKFLTLIDLYSTINLLNSMMSIIKYDIEVQDNSDQYKPYLIEFDNNMQKIEEQMDSITKTNHIDSL